LELFGREFGLDKLVLQSMYVDDMPGDVVVGHFIAVVQDHKEQIKSRHDGCRHVDVLL
jgi:hypothetical protein